MKRAVGLAALAVALSYNIASAQQISVKVGVLTDMSSLYADDTGPGSVAAARLAAQDFMKDHANVKVEIVSADHQTLLTSPFRTPPKCSECRRSISQTTTPTRIVTPTSPSIAHRNPSENKLPISRHQSNTDTRDTAIPSPVE